MNHRLLKFALVTLTVLATKTALADCVYGAKDKTSFVVLDSNTILLKGGYGGDIIVKTYSYIYSTSELVVLKDNFCSYENAVLYIDGEVVDAQQVTRVN